MKKVLIGLVVVAALVSVHASTAEAEKPPLSQVDYVAHSSRPAFQISWGGGVLPGGFGIDKSYPGCGGTCYQNIFWSNTGTRSVRFTSGFNEGVPYRFKTWNSDGHHGYSAPMTAWIMTNLNTGSVNNACLGRCGWKCNWMPWEAWTDACEWHDECVRDYGHIVCASGLAPAGLSYIAEGVGQLVDSKASWTHPYGWASKLWREALLGSSFSGRRTRSCALATFSRPLP